MNEVPPDGSKEYIESDEGDGSPVPEAEPVPVTEEEASPVCPTCGYDQSKTLDEMIVQKIDAMHDAYLTVLAKIDDVIPQFDSLMPTVRAMLGIKS